MGTSTNIQASGEVLVGVDASGPGRSALQWAARHARSTRRRLHAPGAI